MSGVDDVLADGERLAVGRPGLEWEFWLHLYGERLIRIARAAGEALKHGEHEGVCTNVWEGERTDDSCDLHFAASGRRYATLQDAYDALGEP